MSRNDDIVLEITPQVLLKAYSCGIFPMAETADDPGLFWVEPEIRGIIPLEEFHLPRSLRKVMKRNPYTVKVDTAFSETIAACAAATTSREKTWINARIQRLYTDLHKIGHAHSVECWQNDKLVGGLYGVRLGRAFFGESMFSRSDNASKIALVHLVHRLKAGGFSLLDTQFTTDHLRKFGAIEIAKDEYSAMLTEALQEEADFFNQDGGGTSDSILQSFSQMS